MHVTGQCAHLHGACPDAVQNPVGKDAVAQRRVFERPLTWLAGVEGHRGGGPRRVLRDDLHAPAEHVRQRVRLEPAPGGGILPAGIDEQDELGGRQPAELLRQRLEIDRGGLQRSLREPFGISRQQERLRARSHSLRDAVAGQEQDHLVAHPDIRREE